MRPAESLHRPDTRDIGYKEPRPEAWFDPQRDILPADIHGLYQALESLRLNHRWYSCSWVVKCLRDIDPNFHPESVFSAQDTQSIRADLDFGRKDGQWVSIAHLACFLRSIDPTPAVQELNNTDYIMMRQRLQEIRENAEPMIQITKWRDFAVLASDIHHLDPTFNVKTEITSADRAAMRRALPNLLQDKLRGWQGDNFDIMACSICDIDPTFPFNEVITPADIEQFPDILKSSRVLFKESTHWCLLPEHLCAMFALSRKMKPPSTHSSPQSFPEVKKY